MKYTVEAIEKIAATLRGMPKVETKKQEVSKSEGVKLLSKEIKAMQKRGYTMKMIADILTANELSISESVLKSYMQRSTATGEAKEAKKETTAKAKAGTGLDVKEVATATPTAKKSNMIEDVQ